MMEERIQKKRDDMAASKATNRLASVSSTGRGRDLSPQEQIEQKSNMLERMREEVLQEADENVRDTSPVDTMGRVAASRSI